MKFNTNITIEEIKDALHYNKDTGIFTWKRTGVRTKKDKIAGSISFYGYVVLCLNYKKFQASRIAWIYEYGVWPSFFIDHVNGIKTDNRICNLRDVNQKINNQNLHKARKYSFSGLAGAIRHKDKWKASICINGKTVHIGVYDTKEDAHAAYINEKRKIHEGCTL